MKFMSKMLECRSFLLLNFVYRMFFIHSVYRLPANFFVAYLSLNTRHLFNKVFKFCFSFVYLFICICHELCSLLVVDWLKGITNSTGS